ncbi:gfo/Idh/MocA family oxidoreductase [Candidatus Poribacteria bacterium]|nr:MAG: gfo/Idh/MocA family oxidoreductase [Candidatus Poribacteria bacterium]
MMKEIKVGVIGVGGIAQGAHIPNYMKIPGVKVYAVCDIIEERAKEVAKRFDVPYYFTDYKKLVEMDELDAVSVCTPNKFHKDPTVAALKAGKHVLCEKPMATSAEEGREMVEAAKKSGKILMIGMNNRFRGESQVLKKLIDEGELGEIYFARAFAIRRRGIPSWGVFVRKDMSGGGPMYDIGVHILDLTMWLMGFPKPRGVYGVTYRKFGDRPDAAAGGWGMWDWKHFDVEDFAAAFIKFENGASLYLEASWASNIEKDEFNSYLLGDKAGARLFPLQIYGELRGTLVNITPAHVPSLNSHEEEIRRFIQAIREGKPSPIPPEESLTVQKILDAVYKSAETGRQVRIR